ncbi:putative exported protein [Bordetella holmesii 41130]|nr:putative exported protein [Bordetella holmesii ATCC 51541]EWM43369.1 putative exported protein [Bordetella holmesii 41130]
MLSANAEPSYSYAPTVQMGSNGYAYMSPGYSVAPVYAPPPVYVQPPAYAPAPAYAAPVYEPAASYAADPTDPASVNLAPAPVAQTTAATGHVNCARYAMDQSGFDPAGASQWTTQVMVDSYNRALQTCRDQRWGS